MDSARVNADGTDGHAEHTTAKKRRIGDGTGFTVRFHATAATPESERHSMRGTLYGRVDLEVPPAVAKKDL